MSARVQIADETVTTCSTTTNCYRIFAEEMDSLYWLAFLLTADNNIAEQCFVGGLGECVNQTHVSTERARSWARRAIVEDAIRIIRPVPEDSERVLRRSKIADGRWCEQSLCTYCFASRLRTVCLRHVGARRSVSRRLPESSQMHAP